MKLLLFIFGEGKELSVLQMCSRAAVIFLFTLVLIRIAGRRAFGLKTPFDNVILILLGSILGQAVMGVSPFVPTLAAGLVISILHRLFAYLGLYSHAFGKLTKGGTILLYQKGKLIKENMKRSLISDEDLMEEIRLKANVDTLDQVEVVYMERNGQISTIKKLSR